ncbi:PDZ domain-containing protein [Oenococcus sicerae]|uniref:SepM family pheromone-processing serine protease n=1 Tax=Oenococcus sicerae TaxID=2203724 RepID=UPI0010BBE8C2|nr:hypothetical protein OAL24_00578 [Oenococcus sicerae]
MKQKKFIKIISGVFVALMAVVAISFYLALPINAYVETPGEADDINQFMTVAGKHDKTKGSLRLVSVYLSEANHFYWLISKFDSRYSIEPKEDVQGNVSDEVYATISEYQMKTAILSAEEVAFKAAGMSDKIKSNYLGIYVATITKNSHFAKKIKIGDTITKIDGLHFDNASGFQKYLATVPLGKTVTLTVLRHNRTLALSGKTIHLANTVSKDYPKGRNGIGISLVDNVEVTTSPKVNVNVGEISGPSGGLMFTLQLYSQLSGQNIKNGRNISGTGTIDDKGDVGEIGGIDKKIIAAQEAGSTIFFSPYVKATKANMKLDGGKTNWQTAVAAQKKYAPKLKLVPVRNFQDALNYLETGKIINTK